jgi:hypothetical protein
MRDEDGLYRVTVQFDVEKYRGPDSFRGSLRVEFVQSELRSLDVPVFALLERGRSAARADAPK